MPHSAAAAAALPTLALGVAGPGDRGQHHRAQGRGDGRDVGPAPRAPASSAWRIAATCTARGAAAAADDPCPAIPGEPGIGGHDLGRAAVADVAVPVFGDAAIALGDQQAVRPAASCRPSTVASSWPGPVPQLAPKAMGRRGRRSNRATAASGVMPIMVRPLVSKLIVTTTGRSVAMAPWTAASTSSAEDMVSIHSRSAPPAARARACSAKAAVASSMVRAPSGTISSPVGPIEPATTTGRPAWSATCRATEAAAWLSSATRSWAWCSLSRCRLPPKLLVRMMSEPACDEAAMHRGDALGMLDVPQLGAVAGGQAEREQAGAHAAVGQQHRPRGQQSVECGGHDQAALTLARRRGRLSATLVRPTARRRSRSSCRIASRSAVSA